MTGVLQLCGYAGDGVMAFPQGRGKTAALPAGEIAFDDFGSAGERRGAAHAVFEFAHIAGEGAMRHHVERLGRKVMVDAVFLGKLFEKTRGENPNVAGTFAQGRRQQGHDIDAVIKIGAEIALRDGFLEIAIGGADDAHIDFERLGPADALKFALLQHAQQLGLERGGDFADLVEEQGAAMRQFETADALADGAREGALFVTEQFGFDDAFRQRRAIDLDEGVFGARRIFVNGAGEQLLAGAGLAAQQHGGVGLGRQFDARQQGLDRRAFAKDEVGFAARRGRRMARRALSLGQSFFEAMLLMDQPVAVARDQRMHAHRLSHQIGDHGQQPHVVFKTEFELAGPFAVNGQGALGDAIDLDRHAEKTDLGHRRQEMAIGCAGEIGMVRHILDDQRHAGGDDMIDDLLRQQGFGARRLGSGIRGRRDFGLAFRIERENEATSHLHEGGENRYHRAKGAVERLRSRQDFRDLIDAGQSNVLVGRLKYHLVHCVHRAAPVCNAAIMSNGDRTLHYLPSNSGAVRSSWPSTSFAQAQEPPGESIDRAEGSMSYLLRTLEKFQDSADRTEMKCQKTGGSPKQVKSVRIKMAYCVQIIQKLSGSSCFSPDNANKVATIQAPG